MDATAWFALATAIAAGLTLVVYGWLGFYAKRQLDEYRTERRESRRPYVVVDFTVERILKLTVTNMGARPARDLQFTFSEPLTSTLEDAHAVKSLALRNGIPMHWYRVPGQVHHRSGQPVPGPARGGPIEGCREGDR